MKKTIITSAFLLFAQVSIFAQTPAVTPPTDAAVQTPKNEKGKGNYPKGKKQGENKKEKQPKMTPGDRAIQYSNELKTTLTLNEEQYQKVLAVNVECITRKDALKGSGDKGAMKTGKADIKAYRLGEFQKIFTAEQMTAYQNMNDDKNEDKGKKEGNRGEKGKGKGHSKGHNKDSKEEQEDGN